MKNFFDANVYVAEALLGEVAQEMLAATEDGARQSAKRAHSQKPQ
jgi:hypothetical protein